ncbi:AAA family ATPase [Xenorhabdus japonica]|uniref:Wobble nucleotide-excising tRNase n=1 Tax=Xenorhabdus japonica TaxID=53341 RepID=A0A1I5B7W3_9GAMM|nr:AAA family ATPase [Xenorhabdus japonica]SFN70720.1 Wobble nucleotide-excising tRNase [Xenorhabdus japonica]
MIGEIQINLPLATYQNPARLSDLRRINYIFGANGTGKTTISRVIAQAHGHEHCQLQWKSGIELERMVYNRDFVDRNFNQDGPLQGVFTLGENQIEAEREIARLQPEIAKVTDRISSLNIQLDGSDEHPGKRKELEDLEPALRDKCWKQKQLHDSYFQTAFSRLRKNAENFKVKVLAEQASNKAELLMLEELKQKAQTIFSDSIECTTLLENLLADDLVIIEGNLLLQKVIVGSQDIEIAALINRLGNSDWVKQGRKYHEQNPGTCPFCQQPTDDHFSNNLAAFFSEAYDNDIQSLKELQTNYQKASDRLTAAIQRNVEINNPFLNIDLFNAESQVLVERLKVNQSKLVNKLDEPSRKMELESVQPLITQLQALVIEANEATTRHNQTLANITTEKQTLTSQVWRYVLNELADDLQQYHQAKDRLTRTIQGMEKSLREEKIQLQGLQNQVKELEKQTTSIQPTISAINDLLQKFGFHSFSIAKADEDCHYRIIRANGEDAGRSLSEGEKTFITFLYFYYLIKGAQSPSGITTNRVVVFDDPISSLDSDILYIVSSLMKSVMDEARNQSSSIKQIFILTHNVYFHKEISFNRSRPADGVLNEESFWLVKKLQHGSVVERYETNPIRSSYELLWENVKSKNISSISLQNTLRRILENYFTMWGGMSKDEICTLFEGRDKLICQSLFSWVNDGSHSIHDDLYINHGEQTNEAYLRVFQNIFGKAGQIGHYNMMTGATIKDSGGSSIQSVDLAIHMIAFD